MDMFPQMNGTPQEEDVGLNSLQFLGDEAWNVSTWEGVSRDSDDGQHNANDRKKKNREIQARYRARQRQLRLETENEYRRVVKVFESEREENERLRSQMDMLEKTMYVQTLFMKALELAEDRQAESCPTSEEDKGDDQDGAVSRSSCQGHEVRRTSSGQTNGSFSGDERDRVVIDGMKKARDALERMKQRIQVKEEACADSVDDVTNKLRKMVIQGEEGEEEEFKEAIMSVSFEELMQRWAHFSKMVVQTAESYGLELSDLCGDNEAVAEKRIYALDEIVPLFLEQFVVMNAKIRHDLETTKRFLLEANTSPFSLEDMTEFAKVIKVTRAQQIAIRKLKHRWYQDRAVKVSQLCGEYEALQKYSGNGAEGQSLRSLASLYLEIVSHSGKFIEDSSTEDEVKEAIRMVHESIMTFTVPQKIALTGLCSPHFPNFSLLVDAVFWGDINSS